MNPELRKRLIDSIDYLRKMDFFQDYSNLHSEKILKKIFGGEIEYSDSWWDEEKKEKNKDEYLETMKRRGIKPHGVYLKESIREDEKDWIKRSDAEIDRALIIFDTKRVIEEDVETMVDDEMGVAILKRLARISRGVFQPMNMSGEWVISPKYKWSVQEVSFDFKDKKHSVRMVLKYDYIMDMGLRELNEIIKDTGYQYYQVFDRPIIIVVLKEEEAQKLKEERGWAYIPV